MEAAIILGSILGYLISLVIFYYLVKWAVKHGVREALRDESESPRKSVKQSFFGKRKTALDYYKSRNEPDNAPQGMKKLDI